MSAFAKSSLIAPYRGCIWLTSRWHRAGPGEPDDRRPPGHLPPHPGVARPADLHQARNRRVPQWRPPRPDLSASNHHRSHLTRRMTAQLFIPAVDLATPEGPPARTTQHPDGHNHLAGALEDQRLTRPRPDNGPRPVGSLQPNRRHIQAISSETGKRYITFGASAGAERSARTDLVTKQDGPWLPSSRRSLITEPLIRPPRWYHWPRVAAGELRH